MKKRKIYLQNIYLITIYRQKFEHVLKFLKHRNYNTIDTSNLKNKGIDTEVGIQQNTSTPILKWIEGKYRYLKTNANKLKDHSKQIISCAIGTLVGGGGGITIYVNTKPKEKEMEKDTKGHSKINGHSKKS